MAGGSPVGLVYVEVALDYEPYTRGQRNLLKSVQSTTLNVEKSYTDLGIKSAKTFDLMRIRIQNAYDRIANDAKSTAGDIIAAETAKNKKLKQLNDQQFGAQTSLIAKLKSNWIAYSVAVYAIQRGLRAVKTEFTDFESALVDMGKVTDQPLEQIRKDIMSINPVLGDATSLVKGYYQTISAGVTDPARALNLLTTAAKAARAAHVDQSEVIKALTKMMAGFSGEVKTAADASDLLFRIEKLGQTTVSELVPIIGDISTASREAGVSQYEMAAAMSQITLTAGGTSEAATQYKAILMGLMKPNEKLTGLIQNLGFETSVAMVKQLGLADALQQIRGEADKAGVQIGKLFRSSEGMLGLASLSVDAFDTYRQKIEEVKEGAGGAERAFNSWELTSEALDKELDANFSRLMISLGGAIMPAFNEAIKGTNALMPTLSNLIREATKNFTEFWQAAGLASAGIISWWDAIKGGEGAAAALKKFNMGLSQTAKIFKIDENTKGWKLYESQIKETTKSVEKHNDSLDDTKSTLEELGKLEKKVWEDSVKALEKYDEEIAQAHEDMYQYELEQIRKKIKEQEEATRKGVEDQKKALEEQQREWENFYNRIEDYTADTFYRIFDGQLDSFSDFLDEMEDLFLKTLAQMLAKAAAEKIIVPVVASISDKILGTNFGAQTGPGYKFGSGIEGILGGDFSAANIGKSLFEGFGAFELGYQIGKWLKDTFFGGSKEPVYQARYESGIRYSPEKGFWGNPEKWTSWGDSGAQEVHQAIKRVYTESISTLNKIFGDFSPAVQKAMEPFIQYMQVDMWKNFDYSDATTNIQKFADKWQRTISNMFAQAMKAEPVMKVLREQLILDIGGSKAPLEYQLNAINAQYDEWRSNLEDLNATTTELIWLEDQRTDAIDAASVAMENNIATTEQLTNAWEGVARSIQDQIYSLTTGSLSPLPLTEQMGITRSAISSIYGAGSLSPDDIGTLQGLYNDLLTQGKQLYSPSDSGQIWRNPAMLEGQYESLFNETISALWGLSDLAGFAEKETETDVHLHLYIDGEEIGYSVAKQTLTNQELITAIQKLG